MPKSETKPAEALKRIILGSAQSGEATLIELLDESHVKYQQFHYDDY
jgi:hypothetical protein